MSINFYLKKKPDYLFKSWRSAIYCVWNIKKYFPNLGIPYITMTRNQTYVETKKSFIGYNIHWQNHYLWDKCPKVKKLENNLMDYKSWRQRFNNNDFWSFEYWLSFENMRTMDLEITWKNVPNNLCCLYTCKQIVVGQYMYVKSNAF